MSPVMKNWPPHHHDPALSNCQSPPLLFSPADVCAITYTKLIASFLVFNSRSLCSVAISSTSSLSSASSDSAEYVETNLFAVVFRRRGQCRTASQSPFPPQPHPLSL